MCATCLRMGRRAFVGGAAAAALAACSENPLTGRRQLAFVSDAQLAELADQSWGELVRTVPASRDADAQARLARVAAPIARATGRTDLNWAFTVLDSRELNAFVLPNGQVAVFSGLMAFARSDDELAAVLGHEAAHVLARHPAERVSQQLAAQAGVTLGQLILGGENGENAELVGAVLGMGATYGVLLPYSRSHELEADRLGVGLMREAGFDPRASLSFWRRMIAARGAQGQPPEALSTHPADARRLEALQAAVAGQQGKLAGSA